jgi:hypothetical protein
MWYQKTREVVLQQLKSDSYLEQYIQQHLSIHAKGDNREAYDARYAPGCGRYVKPHGTVEQMHTVRRLEVRQALQRLQPMMVSELDKNNGALGVRCAQQWHKTFDATFAFDDHYHMSPKLQHEILELQKQTFMQWDWTRLRDGSQWDNYHTHTSS